MFFLFIAYSSLSECDRDKPIFKDEKCVSTYCDENQFKSGECIINNSIIKKRWINNIIKIENTNGELSFFFNKEEGYFLFGTSLSNNEERIFYGMKLIAGFYSYPFGNNGKFESFINKKIKRSDNQKLTNPEICFLDINKNIILLIGSENSYAEIIDLNKDSNEIISLSQTELFDENKVIKGFSSLLYLRNSFVNLITLTSSNDNNISNYNISMYKFENDKKSLNINFNLNEEFVKGEYLSCFFAEKGRILLISCIYLDINNSFTISLIEDLYGSSSLFSFKNSFTIGKGYEIEENKKYFIKGILSGANANGFYSYFSGDLYEIPTFLYKNIDYNNYQLSDRYDDFPVIYLYDYSFNNDMKFNDIISLQEDNFIFISSLKNREVLIIAYMTFYKSSSAKNQFLVRYYTILLKEYYNIKIFHGLKASSIYDIFSIRNTFYGLFVLAIDFCLYDSCHNSENNISNTGLININFPHFNNTNIDYIECF